MIKILIPAKKGKVKTSCRGFWKDEAGKIYYDYLKEDYYFKSIENRELWTCFKIKLEAIKKEFKQEAIFYSLNGRGYCYYSGDKIEVFKNRIYKKVSRDNLKASIKEALRIYSGATIYQEAGRYYLEIYY